MTKSTEPSNLAELLDAPHACFRKKDCGGRKLQTLTFRYKPGLPQECIDICHDDVEYRP